MHASSKPKRVSYLTGPYFIVFLYTFLPMMVSVEIPGPISPSGSPLAETQVEPEQTYDGMGGIERVYSEDETIDGEDIYLIENIDVSNSALNGPTQLLIKGGKAPEVYRINYFKTVDARLPVDSSSEISSDYGWRTPPCDGCSADHQGVDFVPGVGAPVYAVMDGLVTEAGWLGGYGYWVMIEHIVKNENGKSERWETVYAHLQEDSIPNQVEIGAVVEKGERIGRVGNTGMSTGPHLHFEIRIDGENVDPLPMISSYQVITADGEGEDREFVIDYR